jgi:hypothetical protein
MPSSLTLQDGFFTLKSPIKRPFLPCKKACCYIHSDKKTSQEKQTNSALCRLLVRLCSKKQQMNVCRAAVLNTSRTAFHAGKIRTKPVTDGW